MAQYTMSLLLAAGLSTFLVLVAIAIVRSANLVVLIILSGVYSLAAATWFTVMDAVDVAFTEAAVGAGLSTLFLLAALARTSASGVGQSLQVRWNSVAALVSVTLVGALLVYASIDLPTIGSQNAPAHTHLGHEYLLRTPEDIGIPNVVTAILASYRGFDTLGEAVVIFTAALAVSMLVGDQAPAPVTLQIQPSHEILPVITRLMLPLIVLYAFYVQFHGEYSPGGGFQAGVILATAIMSHALVAGIDRTRQAISDHTVFFIAASGVVLYATVGMISVLRGGDFLDYDLLGSGHHVGQHIGIVLIELGVLATVTGSMLTIYYALNGSESSAGDRT